jgi:citrate lyase beta subunit
MKARILTFSSYGDTTLLGYDPTTADMEEVNRVIAEYEAKTGAQPFDMATGERIERITREQNEVLMVHPIAGG